MNLTVCVAMTKIQVYLKLKTRPLDESAEASGLRGGFSSGAGIVALSLRMCDDQFSRPSVHQKDADDDTPCSHHAGGSEASDKASDDC